MDVEIEQKENKISFLENKIGVTDDIFKEDLKKLDWTKSQKEKIVMGLWIDFKKTPFNHENIKNWR